MILRRFVQHVQEQNWFAVGLDVVVVITGIFLGLQVSDWSAERQNRVLELDYLQRLHQDIQLNIEVLEKSRSAFNYIIEGHSELIAIFSEEVPYDANAEELIERALPLTSAWRHLYLELGTIEELINSGDMDIIQNPRIRKNLIQIKTTDNAIKELIDYYKLWFLNNEKALFTGLTVSIRPEKRKVLIGGAATEETTREIKDVLAVAVDRDAMDFNRKLTAMSKQWTARGVALNAINDFYALTLETASLLSKAIEAREH